MIVAFFVLLYVLFQVQEDPQTDRIVKKIVVRMKIKAAPIEKTDQKKEVAQTAPRAQPKAQESKPEKKPNKAPQKAALTSTGISTEPANKNDRTVLADKKAYQSLLGIETQRYKRKYRIVLLADRPIKKYEAFFLDTPARLIIDLPGAWKNVGYSKLMMNDAKIKRIRVGEHRDKLRIVLDLKSQKPISPRITESPRGLILIIK
ncbi:MAG: AMIN domain-containing protein [Candidatus Desulfatibia sp.]|uniref:AMIN domain-containing protein n=1 Tax=Candidatus Desulfatibia sp. TaxID=3101189 RepID=UPI002F2CC4D4